MLFEIIQTEVQCRKKYFNIFLSQEARTSRNNIEKKPQKPHSKLKNYIFKCLQRIFALPPIQCNFCKDVLIL